MKKWFVVLGLAGGVASFTGITGGDVPVPIPPSKQRTGGNAAKGYDYLVNGDYIRSGIPFTAFAMTMGKAPVRLQRKGINEKIPHDFTAVKASNGELVVAPNCLQCHAGVFEDQLVIGLGNSLVDFTAVTGASTARFEMLERFLKASAPRQYEAAAPFLTATKAISPYLAPAVAGVNTADRLAAVLAAHRDPQTFAWNATAQLAIPKEVVPTDTPPWWLLKKKNAMFYNGFGRGDFGRFLMASNLLTTNDTAESRAVDAHMPDVLAYIYSLEAPKYPRAIDRGLAARGRVLFEQRCSGCHGTYGEKESYPNLLIPQSIIGTDSMLHRSNYSNPQFVDWFNRSWFTQGDHPARLEPFNGYIAPPLDGIWVTAPYLHNGSVPTLEGVLDSKSRPAYWSRRFDKPEYDYEAVGWKFSRHANPDRGVYNTRLPGYGAYGHTFGDALSREERKAVIEYLKTL